MSFKELTAWHQGKVARMPATLPPLPPALVLSPGLNWAALPRLCRASSTFQSGVGGIWVMEGRSVSVVTVRLGTQA